MFTVYLLKSERDKKFYIGCTADLKKRINSHNKGLVESTKNRRPLKLIYYEAYFNQDAAYIRESNLKKYGSSYKGLIKRIGVN